MWKEIMLESNGKAHSQLIFPSKTWFFGIYLNFMEYILIFNISHIVNPNLMKWIPLNPAHQDLSNKSRDTFQFLQNFQLLFNLIFSQEIIQYPRTFAPQVQTSVGWFSLFVRTGRVLVLMLCYENLTGFLILLFLGWWELTKFSRFSFFQIHLVLKWGSSCIYNNSRFSCPVLTNWFSFLWKLISNLITI